MHATKGKNVEVNGILLELQNPRARLSKTESRGKIFSALGELLWYLAGSNKLAFIRYYIPQYDECSDDGTTIHGAYGPRLNRWRGVNQLSNVIQLLRERQTTRRAVIQLFDAEDLTKVDRKDIPCTCSLQFLIREGRLYLITTMRSNDAFRGFTHDVFAFTMLQEIVARSLGCDLGTYKHFVGSLHLYDADRKRVNTFIQEGWQPTTEPMPQMPIGSPDQAIGQLLRAERNIRCGRHVSIAKGLDPYWQDLVGLLQIFRCKKGKRYREIATIQKTMSTNVYDAYIHRARRTNC